MIFFHSTLYLTCNVSFYMQVRSVYPQAWYLYLQIKSWKMKSQSISHLFICLLYLTCIASFICGHNMCTCGYDHMISILIGTFSIPSDAIRMYTCKAASVISIPMGTIGNQILIGDISLWFCFTSRSEFQTCNNTFLP